MSDYSPAISQHNSSQQPNASSQQLDALHHVAIQVQKVDRAVEWYTDQFKCKVMYQDETWALLQFANTSLALVVPGEHPPHLAFVTEQAEQFGDLVTHRDGTRSVYIQDSETNIVECMDPTSI